MSSSTGYFSDFIFAFVIVISLKWVDGWFWFSGDLHFGLSSSNGDKSSEGKGDGGGGGWK